MKLFKKQIDFISKRQIAWTISLLLILSGITSLTLNKGPKLSIDFTGGTVIQIQLNNSDTNQIRNKLIDNNIIASEIITFGNINEFLIKIKHSDKANKELVNSIKASLGENVEIRRIESVGPKIGKELTSDALKAITIALLLIAIYIGFRFDRFYALGSIAAIVHDIIVILGLFSILKIEIDLSIIAALLTIVGYSLNDTIVVFDRIRENVINNTKETFVTVVNSSINDTLNRTIVTSITTLLVVIILFIMGGEVIKNFSLALILGVLVGTYSSIFVASPIMMHYENNNNN